MTDKKTSEKKYTVSVHVTPNTPFTKAKKRVCTIMLDDGKTRLWQKITKVAENANATSVALTCLAEALPALAPKITDMDAPLTFEVYAESIRSILKDGYVNRRYREEIKTLMGSAINVIPNREIHVETLTGEPSTRGLKPPTAEQNPALETKPLVEMLIEDLAEETEN